MTYVHPGTEKTSITVGDETFFIVAEVFVPAKFSLVKKPVDTSFPKTSRKCGR